MKEMTVGLTCELLITPLETPLTHTFDDETGLKLLAKIATQQPSVSDEAA